MTLTTPLSSLNHIAIKVKSMGPCLEFYHSILGLKILKENRRTDNSIRSIWLGIGEIILMLEKEEMLYPQIGNTQGFAFIALTIKKEESSAWKKKLELSGIVLEKETEYTMYFRDPEGNQVGLSHFFSIHEVDEHQ